MDSSQARGNLFRHNIERSELKPGDHIYSWRHGYLYSHRHGIYVDDGKVIHFTGSFGICSSSSPDPCPRCGDRIRESGVISSCLDCFLKGGNIYLFQYGVSKADFYIKVRGKCTIAAADADAGRVVHRAEYLLENNGFGAYNVVSHYSKHFALYCKTERVLPKSSISDSLDLISQAFECIQDLDDDEFSPVDALSNLFKYRYNNDIGVRSDVKKIAVEDLTHHFAS